MSASEVAVGVYGYREAIEALEARVAPREQWAFIGRERHYGYDYLIFELVANPSAGHKIGKRWARVVA